MNYQQKIKKGGTTRIQMITEGTNTIKQTAKGGIFERKQSVLHNLESFFFKLPISDLQIDCGKRY